jgi:DNA-binding transcriptional MocR family regulator
MAGFERKLALWRLLRRAPEGLGLKALADKLGVSKNTVQRDLDELSRAGIQVCERRVGTSLRFWIEGEGHMEPGGEPQGLPTAREGESAKRSAGQDEAAGPGKAKDGRQRKANTVNPLTRGTDSW